MKNDMVFIAPLAGIGVLLLAWFIARLWDWCKAPQSKTISMAGDCTRQLNLGTVLMVQDEDDRLEKHIITAIVYDSETDTSDITVMREEN